jgi:hypothetical protein
MVDEMVSNGKIIESNRTNILKPLQLMDKVTTDEFSFFSRKS